MIAAVVLLVGMVLLFVGGRLDRGQTSGHRVGVLAATLIVLLGVGLHALEVPEPGLDLRARGLESAQAADIVVVTRVADAPREVRRVPLSRPTHLGPSLIAALLAVSVALGFVLLARSEAEARHGRLAVGVGLVSALAVLAVCLSASTMAGTEAEIRTLLASLPWAKDSTIVSFTLPQDPLSFGLRGASALGIIALASLVLLISRRSAGDRSSISMPLKLAGATLLTLAPAGQLFAAGGLVGRPLEGLIWAVAIIGGLTFLRRDDESVSGLLSGLALGLAALAFGVGVG